MTISRPTFKEVPPAHTDERDLQRATRDRQVTFERGIALALVAGMLSDIKHLRSLTAGLRWVIQDDEASQVQRWLESAHEDILRNERIEARYDGRH